MEENKKILEIAKFLKYELANISKCFRFLYITHTNTSLYIYLQNMQVKITSIPQFSP